MKSIIATLLLLSTVTSGPAAANDWKIYRYPEDGFAAEYPGVPKMNVMNLAAQTFVRGVQYIATDDIKTEYLGQALIYRKEIRQNNTPEKILRVSIDGASKAGKCSIRSEVEYIFPAASAREVVFDKCEGSTAGRGRVVLLGDYLFFALGIGRPGTETSADTGRFLASFSVIGK